MTPLNAPLNVQQPVATNPRLKAVSDQLEASFLAEMLKAGGLAEARESFGGGAGEDQFSSFLMQEYATGIVDAGGIGLSQSIYDALVRRQGE